MARFSRSLHRRRPHSGVPRRMCRRTSSSIPISSKSASTKGGSPRSRKRSSSAPQAPASTPISESRRAMYRYDEFDARLVRDRVEQFRYQVNRRLKGELSEDEFKPLRLMNGLYLQIHAYMLRIAIPYGTLAARQLRKLAHLARTYDKGYGHFTTRQNLQFHWAKLVQVPDMLAELAEVEMHCLQTSGNCIRNISADQFAG